MGRVTSYGVEKDRKIYGNCQVLSPDGILMFRCDDKKANWYLNRSLGEIVSDSPLIVKLKFEPKGLGNHNKSFGLSEMGNKCVNCGDEEYLTRHHVVPYCYRRYFPIYLKSHNFHDVLTLCADCHDSYERKADNLKNLLGEKYNISLNGEICSDSKEMTTYVKISNALLNPNINIPRDKSNLMKKKIKDFFGIKRLDKRRLEKISNIKTMVIRKTHGEVVISKVDDIQSFIEMWRSHFLENNDCKYLPKDWSIKTNIRITNE
jgi:exonuclease 3'-5' domain-containing protein 2